MLSIDVLPDTFLGVVAYLIVRPCVRHVCKIVKNGPAGFTISFNQEKKDTVAYKEKKYCPCQI